MGYTICGLLLIWCLVGTVMSYGEPCPWQYGKVKCALTSDCIPKPWECDGIKDDCPGNTDEKGCPDCAGIYCDCNDTFVPWNKVCNFFPECKDGSDEDPGKYGCDCRGFKCPEGYCIPRSHQCDHIIDCYPTGADEIGCPPCEGPDVFQCGTNGPCLYNDYKCNDWTDCPNGEDEIGCPCEFQCPGGKCLIQKGQICNGWPDCPNGEDEKDCPCFTDHTQFLCTSTNNTCVPWNLRCNCVKDCQDGSDEENCFFPPPPPPPSPTPLLLNVSKSGGKPVVPEPTPQLKKIMEAREQAPKRAP